MMMKEENFFGHPSLALSPLNLTLIALASHALTLLSLTLLAKNSQDYYSRGRGGVSVTLPPHFLDPSTRIISVDKCH